MAEYPPIANEEYWEAAQSLGNKLREYLAPTLAEMERELLREIMLELFLSMQRTSGEGLLGARNPDQVLEEFSDHLRRRKVDISSDPENADLWGGSETTSPKKAF